MSVKQFYHDSSSFKLTSLADKCSDLEFVQNVAADIESKQGRQLRTRVFIETMASSPGLHYYFIPTVLPFLMQNFCVRVYYMEYLIFVVVQCL